ncbi:prolyl oligopeptidase family serine peptidase [Streptosporangium sp. 'caverna']|uniref:prolyl oligopeptidase family serine peptidase n=1 Tax=Streptosporangium sp. 'caverna' TaxID=2202249 RepID=UPI000D7D700A|nr:prolyl oligopeptidase family serine peptidase [Streptosporangium sp. 'caverna']AWS45321.1 S9 family peptidase [Streptosporangium sp. 'caverna']
MARQEKVKEQIVYPAARRQELVEKLHGRTVADPYRWLESDEGAECAAWLAAQDDLLATQAATWPQREMFHRVVAELAGNGAVAVPAVTPPLRRAGRRFFLHRAPDQELPVLMVAEDGEPPRALLDPLVVDPSGRTTLDAWRPSWTGELLAYQLSYQGDERPALWVMEVAGRRVVDGPLVPGRATPTAWLAGDDGFYYVTLSRSRGSGAAPQRQVRLHRLGHDSDRDAVVFETCSPQLSVKISPEGRWLMLSCAPGAQSGNLLWLAEVTAGQEHVLRPRLLHDGSADGAQAVLTFGPGGRIYAITDAGAPFGRVCAVDLADPRAPAWRTLIAQDPPAVLTGCVPLPALGPDSDSAAAVARPTVPGPAFAPGPVAASVPGPALPLESGPVPGPTSAPGIGLDTVPGSTSAPGIGLVPGSGSGSEEVYLLLSRSRHGAAELSLHDGEGHRIAEVPTPGPGSITRLTAPAHGAAEAWFSYSDFVTAPAVYRFSLRDRRCHPATSATTAVPAPATPVTTAVPAPSGSVPGRVSGLAEPGQPPPRIRQITYESLDGTPVRMYLIAPAAGPYASGPRPTLLTAYGGFGASCLPAYSPTILAWVRAGGTYAIANVRGGGERGTDWHAAGRGLNKPNAFADFIAAATWLIDHRWTTPRQLAIKGASHSGLMVAAALTQRPELFAAVACSAAVLDMVRYPYFGLGPWWVTEFGDPDQADQFDTLLGYSPYHRVRPGSAYPAVLLISPHHDARVDSMHTRKMTAALQHATTSGNPILLRYEEGVGHGPRAASRWSALQADILAFCAAHTGLGSD